MVLSSLIVDANLIKYHFSLRNNKVRLLKSYVYRRGLEARALSCFLPPSLSRYSINV